MRDSRVDLTNFGAGSKRFNGPVTGHRSAAPGSEGTSSCSMYDGSRYPSFGFLGATRAFAAGAVEHALSIAAPFAAGTATSLPSH